MEVELLRLLDIEGEAERERFIDILVFEQDITNKISNIIIIKTTKQIYTEKKKKKSKFH
jgi:hypothetical protein